MKSNKFKVCGKVEALTFLVVHKMEKQRSFWKGHEGRPKRTMNTERKDALKALDGALILCFSDDHNSDIHPGVSVNIKANLSFANGHC